ncbi:MAG TPA: nickel-binding protein [Gaiellaceae bacterium]|nr:nickel-binding protein [Gaiellaceae bacterium]
MPVYMADRDLPGVTLDALAQAQQAAIETSARFTAEGTNVRYLRSTYVPGEAHVMCLFEADDAAIVEQVNDEAGIPYTRVVEAYDLTP